MPRKTSGGLRQERLDIRVSAEQKTLLVAAANASHVTLSAFILSHALREAEAAVSGFSRHLVVSDDVYDSFKKIVNEDRHPDPAVVARLTRKSRL